MRASFLLKEFLFQVLTKEATKTLRFCCCKIYIDKNLKATSSSRLGVFLVLYIIRTTKSSLLIPLILVSMGIMVYTLREKFPNTEFFLVRIFLYSVRVQEITDLKKLRIWTFFTQWELQSPTYNITKNHSKIKSTRWGRGRANFWNRDKRNGLFILKHDTY